MAEFDDKLNSILSNPELMGQIMSMASSLGQSAPPPPKPEPAPGFGGLPFDPGALGGMMELLKSTQIDRRQMELIRALRGFVPEDRLIRLEKAMQASKIAKYASTALNQSKPGR